MAKKEIGRASTGHIPPFGLRLQPDLKERIESASKTSGRSMNAEIVARLELSFLGGESISKDRYDALEQHVSKMAEAVELGEQMQGRIQRIWAIEHSLSLMLARSVLGLGQRLRRVLGSLEDSPGATPLKAMEPEIVDAMEAAALVLKHSESGKGKIDVSEFPWMKSTEVKR